MVSEFLAGLRHECCGSMAIETAIVAPVLLTLALGGFDAGAMVARQSELQSAAAEAAAIVQANPPKDEAARIVVRDVLMASAGLTAAQVTVVEIFRCDTAAAYVTTNTCTSAQHVSKYMRVTLTDTYTPQWTKFGVGNAVNYNVVRTVQIS